MVTSTFLYAIANIFSMVINMYIWVIIISALITWVNPDPFNPIVQILRRLSEPAYSLVRRFIPTVFSGVDLAPIIVLLALQFIDLFFIRMLVNVANNM